MLPALLSNDIGLVVGFETLVVDQTRNGFAGACALPAPGQ